MRFSLVTINTWKCDGDYKTRIPLLASQLKFTEADFFACQEVFHSVDEFLSTKEHFKKVLQMVPRFFPSRRKHRNIETERILSFSGLCSFTNLNVVEYEEHFLPNHIDDGERTAQLIVVKHGNYRVGIINTHLTHVKGQDDLRVSQLRKMLNNIEDITIDLLILCGDLNSTPESKAVQFLRSEQKFQNVFNNKATHVGGQCIDYIFYRTNRLCEIKEQSF